jgi:hypothetical protein
MPIGDAACGKQREQQRNLIWTNAVPALHEISDSDEIFPIDSISSIKLHDH